MPNFNRLREEIIKNNYLDYIEYIKNMSDRNKAVVIKYTRGDSFKKLAKEYNVSYNRIQKIVYAFVICVRKAIRLEEKSLQVEEER